jgi:thiol-disulfide isomerase/thioredoxin
MTILDRLRRATFDGATAWLNSEPLGRDDLDGSVVLVDFWTLTCINWLRTEPYIRAWSQAYRADGLIVVGVHTPEFSFEYDLELVRRAAKEMAIDYPDAPDNDYAVWRAFDNHYWPALYFVDGEGKVRDHHFGEGRYEQSEREIQRLLGVHRELVSVRGEGVEAEANWNNLRTPETYLGYARGERQSTSEHLRLNEWKLDGEWATGAERVVLDRTGGSIAFRFHARDAHLVLACATGDSIPFQVLLDGAAPGSSHGIDVDQDGHGVLDRGRLYQLIRQPGDIDERTVKISFGQHGAEAYVFTFG